ncbi:MAG TPA: GNAT family N-acetyltransferase [Candidatus Cloacimonadota bacterium]|nr:GNAT family N-acetyltransferase [Candidatus Cloacimonadota bacterium]HPT72396.1 GNAT family N-acetyltransferase [Candidatus Cloacimonadota bacterium]
MYKIEPFHDLNRKVAVKLLKRLWHTESIIAKKHIHDFWKVPGFLCYMDEKIVGVVTYEILGLECEIVSINALRKRKGIGKALFNTVLKEAKKAHCSRLWLITTNDNTNALTFYQLIGMNLCGFYPNAMDYSRKIKPQIPLTGNLGIPLQHELEFEMLL